MTALRETFINELRRIDSLSQVSSVLGWDEQVNLPSGEALPRKGRLKARPWLNWFTVNSQDPLLVIC